MAAWSLLCRFPGVRIICQDWVRMSQTDLVSQTLYSMCLWSQGFGFFLLHFFNFNFNFLF